MLYKKGFLTCITLLVPSISNQITNSPQLSSMGIGLTEFQFLTVKKKKQLVSIYIVYSEQKKKFLSKSVGFDKSMRIHQGCLIAVHFCVLGHCPVPIHIIANMDTECSML